MKCLVTGATGFIGRVLCQQLSVAGHSLIPYSLSGEALEEGMDSHAIDLRTDSPGISQLYGVDAVFHLAGIAHQQALASDYEAVNHQAVLKLARQARDAGVKHFIFLSSVKAMGEATGAQNLRSEGDTRLPADNYGLSKWMAESALNREFGDGDMSVCIVRPALVYGQRAKGNLQRLSRAVGRGVPRPPEGGGRSMIAVEDLCRLMVTLADEGEAGVITYIACDGQCYSFRRIYDAMRVVQGRGRGLAWCPRWLWKIACSALDVRRPGETSTWNTLFGRELYDNQLVMRSTSWRPRLELEDCLQTGGDR